MSIENPPHRSKKQNWTTPIVLMALATYAQVAVIVAGGVQLGSAIERKASQTNTACSYALRFRSPEILNNAFRKSQQEGVIALSVGNHDAVKIGFYRNGMDDIALASVTNANHGINAFGSVRIGEVGIMFGGFFGTRRTDMEKILFQNTPPPDQTLSLQKQCRSRFTPSGR